MSSARLQSGELSILAAIIGGALLAVVASETAPNQFVLVDLVVFLAIPTMAGAFAGLWNQRDPARYGVLVGSVVGLAYVINSSLSSTTPAQQNIVLFLILSVPIWGCLGGAGAIFSRRVSPVTTPKTPTNIPIVAVSKDCPSCKTSNPPDALFCKNCGTKLP